MAEIAIKIESLSKIYRLYDKPIDRMKESLSISKKKYSKEHYALKNITFDVKKGESIGIVGKNGSGKSTLLKIITGVLTQSQGSIEVNGKIAALLELGAGFNPEYTGIENIYLNGTMMGYTKEEMEKRVNPIVEFADIGEFINQPVKTYSSGMFARLAFAVAINVEPEILIVDEALSVGDTRFQIKCIDKMKELKEKGTTILFVSHATEQIKRFCNRAVWINNGEMMDIGESSEIIDKYESYMLYGGIVDSNVNEKNEKKELLDDDDLDPMIRPKEDVLAKITEVKVNKTKLKTFDSLEVVVKYEIYEQEISGFLLGVAIYTPNREYIFGPNTHLDKIEVPNKYGRHVVKYMIPSLTLMGGEYSIDVGIFNNEGIVCIDYNMDVNRFKIYNDYFAEGKIYINHKWLVEK
ncbi:ABC transporter ATP-binding protein [Clostridium neonatale]|uniref:ABC transporter ATP-binding protein n=1 Tax=Clostridium neonatale TaxID=137838 RepID=UPI003D355DF2